MGRRKVKTLTHPYHFYENGKFKPPRMIRLELEAQCKRPKQCRKKTCKHYGIHTFDEEACRKRDCVFHHTETACIVGWFDGKEKKGKPFTLHRQENKTVICKTEPYVVT